MVKDPAISQYMESMYDQPKYNMYKNFAKFITVTTDIMENSGCLIDKEVLKNTINKVFAKFKEGYKMIDAMQEVLRETSE